MNSITGLLTNFYESAFENCISLTAAPALPETTLANACYKRMFYNCSSLVTAYDFPEMKLASSCFESMFENCSALLNGPTALSATAFANDCCFNMFQNCISLSSCMTEITASTPNELKFFNRCFANMFKNCYSLLKAPAIALDKVNSSAAGYCSSMFENCYNLITSPAQLPLSAISNYGYQKMFANCRSLTTFSAFASVNTKINLFGCYQMFKDCISLSKMPGLNIKTVLSGGMQEMFLNCQSLIDLSQINIDFSDGNTASQGKCCNNMFKGCLRLNDASNLKLVRHCSGGADVYQCLKIV